MHGNISYRMERFSNCLIWCANKNWHNCFRSGKLGRTNARQTILSYFYFCDQESIKHNEDVCHIHHVCMVYPLRLFFRYKSYLTNYFFELKQLSYFHPFPKDRCIVTRIIYLDIIMPELIFATARVRFKKNIFEIFRSKLIDLATFMLTFGKFFTFQGRFWCIIVHCDKHIIWVVQVRLNGHSAF